MKRFIICCDGTWESADSGNDKELSNVARFSRMISQRGQTADGSNIEQVVYYQTGVGGGTQSVIDSLTQGATGQGLEENVIKAYYFIATNYHDGDEIMLFGFSRGAYTARALGWYLTKMGVLRQIDLEDFRDIYREFKVGAHDIKFSDNSDLPALRGWKSRQHKKKDEKKYTNAETKADSVDQGIAVTPEEGKVKPEPVTVKVIGVWDTVGALGLPESWLTTVTGFNKAYQFYDTALNDKVTNAFQALALDEHRGAFTPTLWYLEPEFKDKCKLKQVWFPGYHSDAGGGTATTSAIPEVSIQHISLAWMCDQVDGLLTFDEEAIQFFLPQVETAADWAAAMTADPCSFFYSLNVGGSSKHRTPGSYHKVLENEVEDPEVEFITKERMHPAIQLLIEKEGQSYYPKALAARKCWTSQSTPKWDFKDKADIGKGALWHRPLMEKTRNIFAREPLQREIQIREHVIRTRQGAHNFEARLLPAAVKERLDHRNRKLTAEEV